MKYHLQVYWDKQYVYINYSNKEYYHLRYDIRQAKEYRLSEIRILKMYGMFNKVWPKHKKYIRIIQSIL